MFERKPVVLDRLGKLLLFEIDHSEVVERLRITGVEPDRLFQRLDRRVELASLTQQLAKVRVIAGRAGRNLDGALQRLDSFLGPPESC